MSVENPSGTFEGNISEISSKQCLEIFSGISSVISPGTIPPSIFQVFFLRNSSSQVLSWIPSRILGNSSRNFHNTYYWDSLRKFIKHSLSYTFRNTLSKLFRNFLRISFSDFLRTTFSYSLRKSFRNCLMIFSVISTMVHWEIPSGSLPDIPSDLSPWDFP